MYNSGINALQTAVLDLTVSMQCNDPTQIYIYVDNPLSTGLQDFVTQDGKPITNSTVTGTYSAIGTPILSFIVGITGSTTQFNLQQYRLAIPPGATLSITVGSGGTSGQGNSGGASSVSSGTQSISTITANGGTGGNNNTGSGGGLGASGSVSGAQLGITTGSPTYYNISAYGHYDGNGLTNGWGIGGRVQTAGYGVGGNASGYGSGGGGGVQSNSVGWVNGGSGSNGVVIFEY